MKLRTIFLILFLMVLSLSFPQRASKEEGSFKRVPLSVKFPKGDERYISYGGEEGNKIFEDKSKQAIQKAVHRIKDALYQGLDFERYQSILTFLSQ